ncbi:hypothetical protein HK100_010793 [Physocladia obscura]|uniref:Uncharacterized protein n=1 Tax=Physocladia obscura TaxID=109957 RepID=A0AAD5T4S3_9FUNG|nr:hypothetical protein HK100_010793 [Physocladia obscura]
MFSNNMNSRSACPKCDGYGYIHDVLEKHDKVDRKTRCKKCNDCNVCSGSGVGLVVLEYADMLTVINGLGLSARGFLHSVHTPQPHLFNEFIRCDNCIDCKDCIGGIPRNIAKKLPASAPYQDAHTNSALLDVDIKQKPSLIGSSPFFESLFSSDSAHFRNDRLKQNQKGTHQTAAQQVQQLQQQTLLDFSGNAYDDFCDFQAKGWKHETTTKHERGANTRCKHCSTCKACGGKGKVEEDKLPCNDCNLRGFIHPTSAAGINEIENRPHDAPDNLRCFYCQVCPQCKGIGVKSAIKEPGPKFRQEPIKPEVLLPLPLLQSFPNLSLQHQQAPTPSVMVPNIPAPPVLNVVMKRSPDNPELQIPMVELPGIGLVPAEQLLNMTVPMVMMPQIINTAPVVSPSQMHNQQFGVVRNKDDDSGGIDEEELIASRKDVWG